jgi:hypothetical protein
MSDLAALLVSAGAPGRMQARIVGAVKRRAVLALHATPHGEALLLNLYLWAEEGAEGAVLTDALAGSLPAWLAANVARHARDEERHAAWLRARLVALGAPVRAPAVDAISRWKLRRLRALASDARGRFRAGAAVPLFAVAQRMEAMGVRVLERHVAALAAAEDGAAHPTRLVLERIVADERQHVGACGRALEALVEPDELQALAAVLRRVDAIERSFGVLGALGLLAAGYGLRARAAARRLARWGQS